MCVLYQYEMKSSTDYLYVYTCARICVSMGVIACPPVFQLLLSLKIGKTKKNKTEKKQNKTNQLIF